MAYADMPETPDLTAATWAGALADVENLPLRRAIQYAAQTGGKVTVNGNEYDFTGLSDTDYQTKYAKAMADALLEIQDKYGPDYIAQRRKELETADPEGWAQRQKLYDTIMADLGASGEVDPAAQQVENQVLADVEAGGTLDSDLLREAQQSVRRGQAARGNTLGTAAQLQEAGGVADASQALQSSRLNQAVSFLTSGISPSDIQYRKSQQAQSNLSSFMRGETPTAQFKGLTGAQTGAVPTYGTGAMTGLDPNAGAANAGAAVNNFGVRSDLANSQANPWLTGLNMGVQGLQTWSAFST